MNQTDPDRRPSRIGRLIGRYFDGNSLTSRTHRAGIWTLVGFGGNNGLRLISNLILTRLLSPEIFGLMALAQVFLNGVTMLSDVGVRASVIRSTRGDDEAFLNTAWNVQILRGALVAAVSCLVAWPISRAYDQPVLFPLMCALSMCSVIGSFQSISIARANRKLLVKQLVTLSITNRMISLAVTVFFAWQLQSVWALAIGAVIGSTVLVILSHVMLPPFHHRFLLERQALREIMGFGSWILIATLFTFLGDRGQQAVYGLLVPVEVIGLMAIAILISSIPKKLFQKFLNTVILASFSEILRERPQALPRVLRKVRIATIAGAFPMLFLVSFFAQPIIDLLYDDRYAAAGVILTLAALNSAVPILSSTYQNLLLAEGRSDIHAALMFILATSTTLGIWLGFLLFGLVGSLVGVGIAMALMFAINAAIAQYRGYSTGLLDVVAFGIVAAVYVATLWTMEAPAAFLSPDLIGTLFN